jgi:DNA-binding XRE family transcriptional regulator
MKPQFIEQNGKPAFVVLSIDDYNALGSDEAIAQHARDDDDGARFPSTVVDRLVQGENAIKVIREWKEITQDELAASAELSKNFISMLETGRRPLTNKTASILATILTVNMDVLTV